MANQFLRLNDTKLNILKAQNLLAIIEQKRKDSIQSKDVQSENGLFASLYSAFKDFFTKLGKPTIQKRFQKSGSPARSDDYNQTNQEIYDDMHVAYSEVDSLSSVMVKNFNYSETERQMLLNKVKKIGSDSLDYSFYTKGLKSQSLYGSDNFMDNSKIDPSKLTSGANAAEIFSTEGIVTLKRTSNVDRSSLVDKVTGIRPDEGEGPGIPDWNKAIGFGGYEGLFYGMKGEIRPEGGKLHLQYSPDGKALYELGASVDEKMPNRLKMFDNNADTFWEVEYVTPSVTGYKNIVTGEQISVSEFDSIVSNTVNAPQVPTTNNTQLERESALEQYVPVSGGGVLQYLTVNFTVHLNTAQIINWISLNPNNFGQEKYMDILSIQTSEDGSNFTTLEGFGDYEYATTLTRRANEELNPSVVQDTMSPDRFKYAGMGVWTFAARKAAAIRFSIRQTRSYIKPYEVLMIETSQTITTTVTTNPSAWDAFWGAKPETSTSTRTVTNQISIPYLTGQVSGFDVMNLDPGAATAGFEINDPLEGIPVIDFLLGWLFSSSQQTSSSVGPQTITKQWTVTNTDVSRFSIGIRDINIYSYTFSEKSEFISKPYISPAPLYKVSVDVNEQIPKIFSSTGNAAEQNSWIKYYISVDDGVAWYQISPLTHRDTPSLDGINLVPQIININSDVSKEDRSNPLAYIDVDHPVYSVRFKAVLSRPTNIQDAQSYTPTLSSYALQLYPIGGL